MKAMDFAKEWNKQYNNEPSPLHDIVNANVLIDVDGEYRFVRGIVTSYSAHALIIKTFPASTATVANDRVTGGK